jgi:hypothetical protein
MCARTTKALWVSSSLSYRVNARLTEFFRQVSPTPTVLGHVLDLLHNPVIPAKAGIQRNRDNPLHLVPRLRGGDGYATCLLEGAEKRRVINFDISPLFRKQMFDAVILFLCPFHGERLQFPKNAARVVPTQPNCTRFFGYRKPPAQKKEESIDFAVGIAIIRGCP